jgi:ERF superfamily
MHRSSETIGAIATALAKAQIELSNPEKTLTGMIPVRGGERSFRYASLASGLDLVRKCLGQHEIALIQTTAVDQGQITLTTLLVHASGEWVSSIWPVCAAAEPSAHLKGTALTYARRYALFTLVGIAGEDDLDAPDLAPEPTPQAPEQPPVRKLNGARAPSPRAPALSSEESTAQRDWLLQEILAAENEEALALWAHRCLPLKNTLAPLDARAVEEAFEAGLNALGAPAALFELENEETCHSPQGKRILPVSAEVTVISKPVRERDRDHLKFVASQGCLICARSPSDAHHLKFAEARALGRKVSDKFTVPLCRLHHRELHRRGDERAWWQSQAIDPLPIAAILWGRTHAVDSEAN